MEKFVVAAVSLHRLNTAAEQGGDPQVQFMRNLWPEGYAREKTGELFCGTGGWIAVASPAGKRLAWREGYADPGYLPPILDEAMKAWNELPEAERRPGATKVEEVDLNPQSFPRPPKGGLVLASYVRALRRAPGGEVSRVREEDLIRDRATTYPHWTLDNTKAKMDVAWFTEGEWKALLPESPKKGDRFPMIEVVRRRLIRHHFVDLTPNNPVRSWDPEDIKEESIDLIVDDVASVVRLRVEGRVRMESGPEKDPFARNGVIDLGEGKTLKARSKSFDANVFGTFEYDPKKEAFTRFDILVFGNWAGSQEEGIFLERSGSNPLGVALTLADPWEREILWPSVIDGNWTKYFAAK